MDWIIGIGMMALGIAVVVLLWRNYCLRKEAAQFAGKVEQALDAIVTGKEWKRQGELTDSLWDRIETQLAKAEHVFQRKQEESLREKETVKGLISDISHQTRTPLANMKLYVELLEEETLSGEGTGFLAKLCEQTEKMDFLMQSMVKMSRLETGILQIRQEKQDLSETIRRAVADVVPAAAAKEIDLFVDCPDGMMVPHDGKWTQEAVSNILDNAVKYTESSGQIHLSVERQEIFWQIAIADTGKGIAVERQAQIFTRFYREPEVHDKPGVGIGLYLARRIIELQKGYIEVRSETGKGACFRLYLPV